MAKQNGQARTRKLTSCSLRTFSSEGQNLQDCRCAALNYRPPLEPDANGPTGWPDRVRIGTNFDVLWCCNNMFPDQGLERLLGLVQSLNRKIADIDRLGMLDASVLGEEVHPQTFNTLRRIRQEDDAVIEEEEQLTGIGQQRGTTEQQLRAFLDTGGREAVENLPDGIHSGIQRNGARGLFFYFRSNRGDKEQSFWRYYDLKTNNILDNRHVLATLIACTPDTPRVVDTEIYRQGFRDLQGASLST